MRSFNVTYSQYPKIRIKKKSLGFWLVQASRIFSERPNIHHGKCLVYMVKSKTSIELQKLEKDK